MRNNPPRQAIMTPNNLIHELGHSFSGFSGFGPSGFGSLEYGITDTNIGGGASLHTDYLGKAFSRSGMGEGRKYLRKQFNEHAAITDAGNNESNYNPIPGARPNLDNDTQADYDEFVPNRYLFFDVSEGKFDVWNSPAYPDAYGNAARIDTLVHNDNDNATETAADAFLNWIRHGERPTFFNAVIPTNPPTTEENAGLWQSFFGNYLGIFMRNAAIYQVGMLAYYQSKGLFQEPILTIPNTGFTGNLRIFPLEVPSTVLSGGFAVNLPPNDTPSIEIYGYLYTGTNLSDGSLYWLLMVDKQSRLVWTASGNIQHDDLRQTENLSLTIQDRDELNPTRSFDETRDLAIIVGEVSS